ncbi:MAG: alpha/beta hydrolase-fold protein [Planctomycetota bacterium]|jgi:predicted esterase
MKPAPRKLLFRIAVIALLAPAFFAPPPGAGAAEEIELKTASSHKMKYYFSLPAKYKKKENKKWSVLICIEGAGCNFGAVVNAFRQARGKLPFILILPITFSNTNKIEGQTLEKYKAFYSEDVIADGAKKRLDWDEEGLLAIINDLINDYDAEERAYITGFSGGGNAAYMMIFRHPDLLNGAAPACANFNMGYIQSYKSLKNKFTDDDRNFPIHLITGEKDPHREHTGGNENIPGIEPQTDAAEKLLKELGYPNVKRTIVRRMKHNPALKQVIDTFRSYWKGTKRRSSKLR